MKPANVLPPSIRQRGRSRMIVHPPRLTLVGDRRVSGRGPPERGTVALSSGQRADLTQPTSRVGPAGRTPSACSSLSSSPTSSHEASVRPCAGKWALGLQLALQQQAPVLGQRLGVSRIPGDVDVALGIRVEVPEAFGAVGVDQVAVRGRPNRAPAGVLGDGDGGPDQFLVPQRRKQRMSLKRAGNRYR